MRRREGVQAGCCARYLLALPRGVVMERALRPCNRTRHTQDVDTLSGADRINEGAYNHLAASPRAWLFVSEWKRGQARRRLTTDLVSMCPAARTGNPCPRRRHQPARFRSAFANLGCRVFNHANLNRTLERRHHAVGPLNRGAGCANGARGPGGRSSGEQAGLGMLAVHVLCRRASSP